MRLVTYAKNGEEFVGVMSPVGDDIVPASEFGFNTRDMNSFIRQLDDRWLEAISATIGGKKTVKLGEVKLLSPIPRPERDVICLGLNYREHAAEAVKANREAYNRQWGQAVYFSKRVDTAVAPGDKINGHFDICTQLDYEAELAVIIGRDADHVKAKDAQNFILGYTILNDVSARNLQASHQQWYFGKSLDGFTPIGPWIVTKDELPGDPDLGIRCFVNGEKRQDSNTGNMIFDIPYIIAELSSGMTLHAGTIISTGTPSGVALGMDKPKYLNKGDVVRCEIDGIGALVNMVG
jgi:2-keto-4-pentenoate hydratase/2-oxohepta-3-ene-1,7-dioic acid hydratase (catechol pathway)